MRYFCTIIAFAFAPLLTAQVLPKGWYLESSLHLGKAFKHRSTITIDFPGLSYGTELNFEVQTFGKKHWHQICGYPRWGIALSYLHSGNDAEMGACIAVLPNVTVDFFKSAKIRIFGRLGVGLGVVTKPYNRLYNPKNNMVGSYLNNSTTLRLGMAWRISKHLELRPSATFTHFSNAASTLPNLGINIPSFQIGICYMYDPVESTDYLKKDKESLSKRDKRVQFSHLISMGYRSVKTSNGPKFLVWHTSFDAGLYLNRSNRLKIGIEYDYIGATQVFATHSSGQNTPQRYWDASRISLFLADEIMLGRFAILAQLGFYLTQNPGQPWFMSIRLSGRYYLRDPYLNKTAPFLTITMKSHKIVAEYFSMGLGMSF